MPKPPAPLPPGESPRPQPPGPDIPSIKDPSGAPDLEASVRGSVRHVGEDVAARQKRAGRRWDRYDFIGAAIVAVLVALWAVHFSLPTLPPDNVPDANLPAGPN